MTNRRYEYIKGLNGHFEITLYVDTFEEVDEAYKKAVENGATSVLEPKEARDITRRNAEETLKIYGGLGK